jgi:hypothetical protein
MPPDRTPDTGLPSEKAVEAALEDAMDRTAVFAQGPFQVDRAELSSAQRAEVIATTHGSLRAAHDPTLGLDRSVCLRAVVEALRESAAANGVPLADFIEAKFTEAPNDA